jgi:hypothetical protein
MLSPNVRCLAAADHTEFTCTEYSHANIIMHLCRRWLCDQNLGHCRLQENETAELTVVAPAVVSSPAAVAAVPAIAVAAVPAAPLQKVASAG